MSTWVLGFVEYCHDIASRLPIRALDCDRRCSMRVEERFQVCSLHIRHTRNCLQADDCCVITLQLRPTDHPLTVETSRP